MSSSLFVRNVHFETAPEDLRKLFSRYGYVRDVYIPLDYYTREPRGFAYVEFEEDRHAKEAMEELDGYRLHSRELEIVFAEGDRKNPNTMRRKESGNPKHGGGGSGGRRSSRSRSRSPRRRRSRSPRRSRHSSERRRSRSATHSKSGKSASRSPSGSPPRRSSKKTRSPTRSPTPRSEKASKSKSISRSPSRSRSR